LEEEALDHTLWRTRFGRGCGPVVRQTAELMNLYINKSEPSADKYLYHNSVPHYMKIYRSVEPLRNAVLSCHTNRRLTNYCASVSVTINSKITYLTTPLVTLLLSPSCCQLLSYVGRHAVS